MNEGAALRVLSFLSDTNQNHIDSLTDEQRNVTIIGEENAPDETLKKEPSPTIIESSESLIPPERIKEFFQTVEEGSIERLDALFNSTTDADANMTLYNESLLMAAIRNKKYKVAEYLIDQLGINVNYTTEFLEFRTTTHIPFRGRTVSCRDLAYDKGMMDLVDLIDIVSDEVKPNIKRYLQCRLKNCLDQIHQSHVKRMKERNNHFMIRLQEKENKIVEEDEQEKEDEGPSRINSVNNVNLMPPTSSMPPVIHRTCESHIQTTIKSIASSNDKSIDETGKKKFRFSDYTLRYRLVETVNNDEQVKERSRPKTVSLSLPTISSTTPRPLPGPFSRPTTTATNINHRSLSEGGTHLPIRETRTSISRSARRTITPRAASTVHSEAKSDVAAATTAATNAIHTTQRLLPKRTPRINKGYFYIPQLQHAVYNDPGRFMPVTFKSTATALSSNVRFIRD